MAKIPPKEKFRIVCETETSSLGEVMSGLAKMPLVVLGTELVTEIATYGQRNNHPVNGEEYLREWLKEHPTFGAKEAVRHFREAGRTDGSAYTSLRVLIEKGELKKIGPGNYSRPDVKAIAGPKTKKPTKITREHHDVDHREFILRCIKQAHGKISLAALKGRFEKEGRKASSVGGAIWTLRERGLIKQIGDGEYELKKKSPPKPKAPVNDAPVTEETANG